MTITRRQFLTTMAATGSCALAGAAPFPAEESKAPTAARLPRWRGFNLLEKFNADHSAPFVEKDFAWTAEWGFDFVRLPLSYRCWSSPDDWKKLKEPVLKEIDQAVEFGRRHQVHVNLNFHRAPGYCVNPPAEPLSLWSDEKALEACAFHWAHFARRYQGIPNDRLSFNLLNEPAKLPEEKYKRVIRRLVEAIREQDAGRLILVDGLDYGRIPLPVLAELKIAQSAHHYDPFQLTHYKASWARGSDRWPVPTWPYQGAQGQKWDRDYLRAHCFEPWKQLEGKGVGVHFGEWGAHNRTPHDVVLAWMRDTLAVWKEAGFGWALWNLRGSFGVLDSGRGDVAYEDFHSHKLDREMLQVLQKDLE